MGTPRPPCRTSQAELTGRALAGDVRGAHARLARGGREMTSRQRGQLRALLQKMRAAAIETGPQRIEPKRNDDGAVGVADEDAQALSEMLQAISSSRNKGQAAMLARIDRAL